MTNEEKNNPLIQRKYYNNPLWYLCTTMVVLGCILEPSVEYVSLFGYPIPEICYVKRCFGLSCLGCGLTRSVVYTFHLDLSNAIHMHLGGIPISCMAFSYMIQQIYITVFQKP